VFSDAPVPQVKIEQIKRDNTVLPQDAESSSMSNVSMQILGGFIAAIGCAAVAIAFVALNAATLGVAGLVVAGLGVASVLAGVGLFAIGTYKTCQTSPNEHQELSGDFACQ
jgi:nucleoside permease NupC